MDWEEAHSSSSVTGKLMSSSVQQHTVSVIIRCKAGKTQGSVYIMFLSFPTLDTGIHCTDTRGFDTKIASGWASIQFTLCEPSLVNVGDKSPPTIGCNDVIQWLPTSDFEQCWTFGYQSYNCDLHLDAETYCCCCNDSNVYIYLIWLQKQCVLRSSSLMLYNDKD